jgi:Zn-dependent protease
MTDFAVEIALAVVAGILAITLHEAAHGYAALALGDDTARVAGRLSLNPLRHIDRVGTILLPGALAIGQLLLIHRVVFMFGWAKPVPVAAWKFANPRRGMAIVAAAGPAMNFFLAWLGALSLHLLPSDPANLATGFVEFFILYNLVLGLFNLLPIPPLDGGRIVVGLLPEGAARAWAGVERAGIVIVLLAVFLLPQVAQQFGYHFNPIETGLGDAVDWARRLVMTLAGHGADMGADDGSLTI